MSHQLFRMACGVALCGAAIAGCAAPPQMQRAASPTKPQVPEFIAAMVSQLSDDQERSLTIASLPLQYDPPLGEWQVFDISGPCGWAADGDRFTLLLDRDGHSFWIMHSGGFIGQTMWYGPGMVDQAG